MDWVELRHFAEEQLAVKAPGIWSDLCATIEQVVKSYNRLYAVGRDVEYVRPTNTHLRVTRPYLQGESASAAYNTLELKCDPDSGVITGNFSAPYRSVALPIKSDESGGSVSLYYRESAVTTEEASKILLETMFFGPFDRTAPID